MGRATPFPSHLTNEDWFDKKIKSLYENEVYDANASYQVSFRDIDRNIMNVIVAYNDTGIAHLQLAAEVKIDRKNLTTHTKTLIEKGLVMRTRGKQGKYFPTVRGIRGVYRSARLIGQWATEEMLADTNEDEEFPVDSPFLSTEFFGKPLPDILYEFSKKIGFIVTYLIIQSMNFSNISDSNNLGKHIDVDLEIGRWFDDALSSVQPVLVPFLWHCIVSHLKLIGYHDDKHINLIKPSKDSTDTSYLLDDKTISKLIGMLFQEYPKMISKLEKNRSQMPKIIEGQLRHQKYIRYMIEIQQKCYHDWGPPSNKVLYEKSGKRIQHCHKCHKTKYDRSLFL
ncbi:MAG TPA: MarR family winged helix-turn-helix transcriptional regulator [Nitrososphaeraceae archaeon]